MSELTEDQKLVKLGLRSPNQTINAGAELLEKLKSKVAEEWDKFQENFEDASLSSFDEFETWLVDNGFDQTTATNIRNKFEDKYPSFSEFKTTLIDEYDSWEAFENDFASNAGLRSDRKTDNGLAAAGMKVYEESGVGRSGQSIPAGGVEIYGKEIHFSQSSAVRDTKDESSGADDAIEYSNLSVSPTGIRVGDTVTVEADLDHNTPFAGSVVADFIVDGNTRESKTIQLTGNDNKTVSFEYTAGEDGTGTFALAIEDLDPVDVTVIYGGL